MVHIRYVSLNMHQGYEQCRRDDMESLDYILINFLTAWLPWTSCRATASISEQEQIIELKKKISIEELCKEIPEQFALYMDYGQKLKFEQQPASIIGIVNILYFFCLSVEFKIHQEKSLQIFYTFCCILGIFILKVSCESHDWINRPKKKKVKFFL